jgi:hypothetical protein
LGDGDTTWDTLGDPGQGTSNTNIPSNIGNAPVPVNKPPSNPNINYTELPGNLKNIVDTIINSKSMRKEQKITQIADQLKVPKNKAEAIYKKAVQIRNAKKRTEWNMN